MKLKTMVDIEGVYGPEETAQRTGWGIATIWRWLREKKLMHFKLNGQVLIPEVEVERLKKLKAAEKSAQPATV